MAPIDSQSSPKQSACRASAATTTSLLAGSGPVLAGAATAAKGRFAYDWLFSRTYGMTDCSKPDSPENGVSLPHSTMRAGSQTDCREVD
jgi:hypothetical protein